MTPTSWAEINLAGIRWNVEQIKRHTGRRVIAVVKADAYGHGMIAVSRALIDVADMFAVATFEEALELSNHVREFPILNLFPILPDQMEPIVRSGIHQVAHSLENLDALNTVAIHCGVPACVHLKIDTGMHRIGFPHSDIDDLLEQLPRFAGLSIKGISTHFASADDTRSAYTQVQLRRFCEVVDRFAQIGIRPDWVHAANSAAVLRSPDAYFNAVRPGLLIYGLRPEPDWHVPFEPQPALAWKSRVIQVREVAAGEGIGYGSTHQLVRNAVVATVPVGYADGYRRALSNRSRVLINSRPARILGRVCMDQIMCDVSDIPNVIPGSEVVLLGKQGGEEITAQEHATLAHTIHYEILTGIGSRVSRIYHS